MKKWISLCVLALLLGAANATAGTVVDFNVGFSTFTGRSVPVNWGPLTLNYDGAVYTLDSNGFFGVADPTDPSFGFQTIGGILHLGFSYPTWNVVIHFGNDYPGIPPTPTQTQALAAVCDSTLNCGYVQDGLGNDVVFTSTFTYPAASQTSPMWGVDLDFLSLGSELPVLVDSITFTSEVPEPATFLLLGLGLAAVGGRRLWRSRSSV